MDSDRYHHHEGNILLVQFSLDLTFDHQTLFLDWNTEVLLENQSSFRDFELIYLTHNRILSQKLSPHTKQIFHAYSPLRKYVCMRERDYNSHLPDWYNMCARQQTKDSWIISFHSKDLLIWQVYSQPLSRALYPPVRDTGLKRSIK